MGQGLMLPCPKIVRRQQQLTPEQEAYAHEFARERLASLLSPVPIDEQEAEAHLRAHYRAARMGSRVTIRWFASPLSYVQARAPYVIRHNIPNRVWHTSWGAPWNTVQTCGEVGRWAILGTGVLRNLLAILGT
jgi:hypothetical protein